MKSTLTTLTIVLFFSINLFAQEIDPGEYKIEKSQLEEKKAELLSEKESLEQEFISMRRKIEELEASINVAWPAYLNKKYGKIDGGNLAMGRIWKGMTKEMMMDIWGQPDKQHTDRFSYGVFTQLYYGKITYFFKNGKMTDWEEVE
ncbi:MAG: hypothetical protein KKA84_05000 [Bacteroidetes bacterium]|nr:hypothetical protein [Bacteroidota bacterium]